MVNAVAGSEVKLDLHLWHGINPALILSVITVGLGIAVFVFTANLKKFFDKVLNFIGWGPDKGFDQFICCLTWFAALITRFLQTGQMRTYMRVTFFVTALILLVPMFKLNIWPKMPNFPELRLWEMGVFVILVVGIIQVVFARTRLTAIISLGIQGFSVALIFMMFGAPDLSFTQFMVETLSVVIIALVLTRLKLMKQDRRSTASLLFDGVVALSVGVGMGALLMNITQAPIDLRLSEFFSTYSAAIAHGRNIVNVILVDFRAIDTLGEITVVLITGVSALALIRVKAVPDRKTKTSQASSKIAGSEALKETS